MKYHHVQFTSYYPKYIGWREVKELWLNYPYPNHSTLFFQECNKAWYALECAQHARYYFSLIATFFYDCSFSIDNVKGNVNGVNYESQLIGCTRKNKPAARAARSL